MHDLNCPGTATEDAERTGWLREIRAAADTVSQLLAEDNTLVVVLYYVTRDDL